jgi:WD40-like Beta Propeller Repeat
MTSTILLHVRPDGSGHATITSRLYLSGLRAFDAIFAASGEAPRRPPQIEEELTPPGEGELRMAFGTPVTLVSSTLDKVPDGGVRTTEIEFEDVRKLQMLFPPTTLGMRGNGMIGFDGVGDAPLMTFAIRPHENGDRMLVLTLPNPTVARDPNDPITVFQTDSQEERLFKDVIKNMSLKLFVEIEPPLLRTNAPRQDGNRVTILDLDLDKMINAMDETRARRMMTPGSFQEMLWQIGDLPGAVMPTEREVFLEYEGPQQQTAPPAAPPPPDSEIYLASLKSANGQIIVGSPENITNSPGYDNQPCFTADGGAILFASVRIPTPALRDNANLPQTDIWRYDIASKSISRVTQTPENEYSPTVMLDRAMSVVRVEADGAQRLARIAPSGVKIQVDVILPGVKPVGYHAWADDHTLALFVLGGQGAPATLQLADTNTGSARIIATDIGRSIQRMPGTSAARHISFVQRERNGDAVTLTVKELDPVTGAVTTLTPAVEGSREADLAWTPEGTLLMAKDDVLYAWTRGQSGWKEIASFRQSSLRGVTRLAVSPKGDLIALVAQPR